MGGSPDLEMVARSDVFEYGSMHIHNYRTRHSLPIHTHLQSGGARRAISDVQVNPFT